MTMTGPTERARALRPAEKSAEAFRTIGEVATELDVPQHVLRFWETRFGQIRPLKRGGGRRYYRPEDVALLRRIRALLYDNGYTIKGVQRLLRAGGARALREGEGAEAEGPAAPQRVPREPGAGAPAGRAMPPVSAPMQDSLRKELAGLAEELEALSEALRKAAE